MNGIAKPLATSVDFVIHLLQRYTVAGELLVDVGCGPGHYRHSTAARYLGVDRNTDNYRAYRKELDVVAEATALPFAAGTVDMLMTKSAFHLFGDHTAALLEFRRVLRPGGRLLVIDYNRRGLAALAQQTGDRYPGWTQWGLRSLVAGAGFSQARVELPYPRLVAGPERTVRLLLQEMMGQWAIVTAVR